MENFRNSVLCLALCFFMTAAMGCSDTANPCNVSLTPIVFAHGFMETGDAFADQSMRFASNGYCLDRIFALDWNTIGDFDAEVGRLEAFIDGVLAKTGAHRINLVGHSMGTALSVAYLEKPENAAKVSRYVNVAGVSRDSLPGGVPTMTISSNGDMIVGICEIVGAQNVVIPDQDHLQVITSAESFSYMYRFFSDGLDPTTTGMIPNGEVRLAGRLVTFAENLVPEPMELRIYPFDPATGNRLQTDPAASFLSDSEGGWGPFDAEPGLYYEYEVADPAGGWQPIHYFREPLPRSCDLVNLRVFPSRRSMLGLAFRVLLGLNPKGMLLATLNASRAVVFGRDTLFVDGYEVSSPEVTPAKATKIAFFYTDIPFVQPGHAPRINEKLPFIGLFDVDVKTETPRAVALSFDGRSMAVPNLRSGTDGVVIGVFE